MRNQKRPVARPRRPPETNSWSHIERTVRIESNAPVERKNGKEGGRQEERDLKKRGSMVWLICQRVTSVFAIVFENSSCSLTRASQQELCGALSQMKIQKIEIERHWDRFVSYWKDVAQKEALWFSGGTQCHVESAILHQGLQQQLAAKSRHSGSHFVDPNTS